MAVGIDCARIEAVACTVAAEAGYNNLKQEQAQAVVEFVCGRDIFVKSLIYGILPKHRDDRKRRQPLWLLVHCQH